MTTDFIIFSLNLYYDYLIINPNLSMNIFIIKQINTNSLWKYLQSKCCCFRPTIW